MKAKTKRWMISLTCYSFATCGQSLATFITVCILILTNREDLRYLNFFAMIYFFRLINYSFMYIIPRAVHLFNDVRGSLQRIEIFLKATELSQEESIQNCNKECITLSPNLEDLDNKTKY